jgi:hypothetical protein
MAYYGDHLGLYMAIPFVEVASRRALQPRADYIRVRRYDGRWDSLLAYLWRAGTIRAAASFATHPSASTNRFLSNQREGTITVPRKGLCLFRLGHCPYTVAPG